jgi:hypothetical protein
VELTVVSTKVGELLAPLFASAFILQTSDFLSVGGGTISHTEHGAFEAEEEGEGPVDAVFRGLDAATPTFADHEYYLLTPGTCVESRTT